MVAAPEKISTMIVVAAALIDAQGRVLVQQRPEGRAMAGLWEFPGGKMEAGEGPEAALVRELAEELGIQVERSALAPAAFASADNGGRPMLLLLYLCRAWRGTPRALDAAGLQWRLPGELRELAMPPADAPLIVSLEALL